MARNLRARRSDLDYNDATKFNGVDGVFASHNSGNDDDGEYTETNFTEHVKADVNASTNGDDSMEMPSANKGKRKRTIKATQPGPSSKAPRRNTGTRPVQEYSVQDDTDQDAQPETVLTNGSTIDEDPTDDDLVDNTSVNDVPMDDIFTDDNPAVEAITDDVVMSDAAQGGTNSSTKFRQFDWPEDNMQELCVLQVLGAAQKVLSGFPVAFAGEAIAPSPATTIPRRWAGLIPFRRKYVDKDARLAATKDLIAKRKESNGSQAISGRSSNGQKKSGYKTKIAESLPPISKVPDMFHDMVGNALLNGFGTAVEMLLGKTLKVATMCSGTESPMLAITEIRRG